MTKEVVDKVKEIISERTGVEKSDIVQDSSFMEDLNINEMELAEIVAEIEEALKIELDVEIEELKTVGDLLHLLQDVLM